MKPSSPADLELFWRGCRADFIGPVAPPMVIAMRQPGYMANEWSFGPSCPFWPEAVHTEHTPGEPPIGHQFSLLDLIA